MLINPPGVWLRMTLASLLLAGCRGGASPPQRTSASHAVPTSHPVPTSPSALSSARSDGGRAVYPGNLRYISRCLEACWRLNALCHAATPECEDMDRLREASGIPNRIDGAANPVMTAIVVSVLMSERTAVCVQRCGRPNGLCENRCYEAVEDAGSPQRQP